MLTLYPHIRLDEMGCAEYFAMHDRLSAYRL